MVMVPTISQSSRVMDIPAPRRIASIGVFWGHTCAIRRVMPRVRATVMASRIRRDPHPLPRAAGASDAGQFTIAGARRDKAVAVEVQTVRVARERRLGHGGAEAQREIGTGELPEVSEYLAARLCAQGFEGEVGRIGGGMGRVVCKPEVWSVHFRGSVVARTTVVKVSPV